MINCSFNVQYNYDIHFVEEWLKSEELAIFLKQKSPKNSFKILPIIDKNVAGLYPRLIQDLERYLNFHKVSGELLAHHLVPAGEMAKNDFKLIHDLYKRVQKESVDRHSYILSIGGGSTNDLAGLIATTAHRGLKHIRIPTTVLAQNDAAIGVKNGVNFHGSKNFIGTFSPPDLVINSFCFLKTLDARQKSSGYAEAVKISLIKDKNFFELIETNLDKLASFDQEAMKYLIKKTAELHLDHFQNSGDPFESGNSRPLDYGHWLAHKVEQLSDFEISHGEAVGLGMALDTLYANEKDKLTTEHCKRILTVISKLNLLNQYRILELVTDETINTALDEFRVHLGGELSIPLLSQIGEFNNISAIDTICFRNQIEKLHAYL